MATVAELELQYAQTQTALDAENEKNRKIQAEADALRDKARQLRQGGDVEGAKQLRDQAEALDATTTSTAADANQAKWRELEAAKNAEYEASQKAKYEADKAAEKKVTEAAPESTSAGAAADSSTSEGSSSSTTASEQAAPVKEPASAATSSPTATPTTAKSSTNANKYEVKNHMYPDDLMSDESKYGKHYVIFYINVASDSKLVNGKNAAATVNDMTPRDAGDMVGSKMTKTGLVASNATVNTIGGVAAGSIALGGGIKGAAKGAAIANIGTVGVGVASTLAPEVLRGKKRLKTAIALHVPNQLQIRYGVQWSDEDTAILAMASEGGEEIVKALSGDKNSDVTGVGAAIIANLALSKGPNAGANSAALGLAANPKKEQVFKGVDYRSFQFEYQFFPRSVNEARNVLRIIEEFKYHMHPEFKDDNNFVYVYPSEFDIFYYQNGKENPNLHRHTSCVLTEMSINYTPNGSFNTFANGMPTQINVQLSFRELALLTKDKIKAGL
jgi:hypothetical protein